LSHTTWWIKNTMALQRGPHGVKVLMDMGHDFEDLHYHRQITVAFYPGLAAILSQLLVLATRVPHPLNEITLLLFNHIYARQADDFTLDSSSTVWFRFEPFGPSFAEVVSLKFFHSSTGIEVMFDQDCTRCDKLMAKDTLASTLALMLHDYIHNYVG